MTSSWDLVYHVRDLLICSTFAFTFLCSAPDFAGSLQEVSELSLGNEVCDRLVALFCMFSILYNFRVVV